MQRITEEQKVEFTAQLLPAIHARRAELTELLAKYSSHWGYEDGVYRFYHHSFKVLRLTRSTEEIVAALRALLPARELNEQFMEIIREGTRYRTEDSGDEEVELSTPRQIVEAFFHARFMLEMAVRYASLEEPPHCLPSGWAALLYLYDIR